MLNLYHGRTFEGHGVTFLHLYCRGTLISYLEISSAVFLLHGRCISLGHLPSYLRRFLLACHALQPLQQPFLLECYSSVHARIFTYMTPLICYMLQSDPCLSFPDPDSSDYAPQPFLQPFSAPQYLLLRMLQTDPRLDLP